MRQQTKHYATLIALFGLLEPGASFISTSNLQDTRRSLDPLHLVPGQGNQLVAAYNAAMSRKAPSSAVDYDEEGLAVPDSRNFVQRVFSLPSSMIKRHPHPSAEGLDGSAVSANTRANATENKNVMTKMSSQNQKKEDVVYYPVTGFTFVKNGENVVALPTKSNVSCRLPPSTKNQEVYGWFSPACKLDLYAEDPCHAPDPTP